MQIKVKQSGLRHLTQPWLRAKTNEAGLTLLEALMAIIVIGITVSAITPAFVLALATRVQSQKAEQAMQLAQDEIDKARIAMELSAVDDPSTSDPDDGDRAELLPIDAGNGDIDEVEEAPAGILQPDDANCQGDYGMRPQPNQACLVDINGDGDADFAVQAYLGNVLNLPNINGLAAFDIGVRVYDRLAVEDGDLANLRTEPARVGLTSNPRTNEGSSYLSAPLAVIYTTIVRSEERNSLCEYYQYQGVTFDQLNDRGLTCDNPNPNP